MLAWIDESIRMIENAQTDQQWQAVREHVAHGWGTLLTGVPFGGVVFGLVEARAESLVAAMTPEQIKTDMLPSLREMRGRYEGASANVPTPVPPPLPGRPAAPAVPGAPSAPTNTPTRPGCFGGAAVVVLRALGLRIG